MRWWVVLACLALAAPGLAQPEPAPELDMRRSLEQEARALFEAGRVAFDGGRYENALDAFTRAFEASGHVELVFNMAQCLDRLRRDAAAIAHYERFLASGPADAHREYVERRLAVLRARHTEATELARERDALQAEVERLRAEREAGESDTDADSEIGTRNSESESESESASDSASDSDAEAESEADAAPMLRLRVRSETPALGLALETGTAYRANAVSASVARLYDVLCHAPCETELAPGDHPLAIERQGTYYPLAQATRLDEDATLVLSLKRPIVQRVIGAVAVITGLGLGATFTGLLVSDSGAGTDDHLVRNATLAGVGGALLLTGLITLLLAEARAGVSVRTNE